METELDSDGLMIAVEMESYPLSAHARTTNVGGAGRRPRVVV